MSLSLQCLLVLMILIGDGIASSVGPFETWTKSVDSIPQPAQAFGVIYDESYDPSNIYLIGGLPCDTCVYSYNIASDAISSIGSLGTGFWGVGDPIAVSINGTVYHTSTSGQIATYDIATGTQTVLETNNNIKAGCINKHPTKRELYIKGSTDNGNSPNGAKTTQFYIYDIDNDVLTLSSNSLVYSRNFPLCVVCVMLRHNRSNMFFYFLFFINDHSTFRFSLCFLCFVSCVCCVLCLVCVVFFVGFFFVVSLPVIRR